MIHHLAKIKRNQFSTLPLHRNFITMAYLFTSESVSEGHPDKVADQISDAILDEFLAYNPTAKVACETLVTTGLVLLAGEVKSDVYIDLERIARQTIRNIGYNKSEYKFDGDSCAVISTIHEQSDDINRGVNQVEPEEQGAGDQGMMYGYATNETEAYMPLGLHISHLIVQTLANVRKEGSQLTYLRPDAKAQVTIEYSEDNQPLRVHTIVISTQHDAFADDATMQEQIAKDMKEVIIPMVKEQLEPEVQALFNDDITYHINPTGRFVEGGPHGDSGLTGRKIIVDTYGGKGAHGGGAFSGKDPSKVDRSGAYAARYVAKNLVAAGVADEVLIQVSYAIGEAEPMSIYINTYGTAHVALDDSQIADQLRDIFDFRPGKIIQRLNLLQPIYSETASYGHMGREPRTVTKRFTRDGVEKSVEVDLFPWERLDLVPKIQETFKIMA